MGDYTDPHPLPCGCVAVFGVVVTPCVDHAPGPSMDVSCVHAVHLSEQCEQCEWDDRNPEVEP